MDKSFPYTFHFFWGATEVVKNFLPMWNSVPTNKVVGTFYIDSPTGKAFSSPKLGLAGGMAQNGYREIPGGFFKYATDDFTNQISAFKNGGASMLFEPAGLWPIVRDRLGIDWLSVRRVPPAPAPGVAERSAAPRGAS